MATYTEHLAEFANSLRRQGLSPSVQHHTAVTILDWVGAALAGAATPSGAMVRQLEPLLGGRSESILLGTGTRSTQYLAAMYNGTTSSVHELDDVHLDAPIHPAVVIIPAVMAVAEPLRSTPQDLLTAVVVGYEVMTRVGAALGRSHYERWHSTSTAGCLGSAAAVGYLLGLDAHGLTRAMGLGAAQAGGVWEELNRDAIMVKHFHGGRAASAGIIAAYLAQAGYPGAATVLEGPRGLLGASSSETPEHAAQTLDSLGDEFMVKRNFFKRYPCCMANFQGIDALTDLVRQHDLKAGDVTDISVRIASNSAWMVGNGSPQSIYEAKFSLPFALAAFLIKGRVGLDEYTDEMISGPYVQALMARVNLVSDDSVPHRSAIVTVTLANRGPVQSTGFCKNMELPEVVRKVHDVMSSILGPTTAQLLEDRVLSLPSVSNTTPLFTSLEILDTTNR